MKREEELNDPESCLNRARPGELLFVLLGRDVAAPDTIRHWVALRCAKRKNKITDPQMVEALRCAEQMEDEQKGVRWAACQVCKDDTPLACSDCAIDGRGAVHVCSRAHCREVHEKYNCTRKESQ